MNASESHVGMWYQCETIIFTPTKARMIGQPLLQVREPVVHVGEQEVQRPQAEDGERVRANTMNCSRLTARTAGTESTANTTSVVSMSTSTANSGVASRLRVRLA